MRLLEGLDQCEGDIGSQNRLKFVLDSRDETVEDEWRAIAAHSLLLKVWLGLRLQGVHVRAMSELGEVDLWKLVDLPSKASNLIDDLDNHFSRCRDQHIIDLENLGCVRGKGLPRLH